MCGAFEFAADFGFAFLRDGHGPAGYTLLIAGLSALLVLAIAMISFVLASVCRGRACSLGHAHGFGTGPFRFQLLAAVVLGLVTWFGVRLASRRTSSAALLGLVAGGALAVGWIAVPIILRVHWPELDEASIQFIVAPLVAHGVSIFALAGNSLYRTASARRGVLRFGRRAC